MPSNPILFPFSPYSLLDSVPPFLKKYLKNKELIGKMGAEQRTKKELHGISESWNPNQVIDYGGLPVIQKKYISSQFTDLSEMNTTICGLPCRYQLSLL